MNKNLI